MYIYSTLRKGITPEINAIGTIITVVSLALILASVVLLDNDRKRAAAGS
jgi:spermidine/putrescine transport system permease protein